MQSALRRAFVHHRKRRRHEACEQTYARTRQMRRTRTPLDELIDQEQFQVIRRILKDHATTRMRLVYQLRGKQQSFQMIADRLGVSPETAMREMRKVREIVREQLLRRGWSES